MRTDIATLDFTLGQKKLLLHAIAELNSAEKIPKAGETKPIKTTAVTTKKIGEGWRFRRATEKRSEEFH